MVHKYTEDRFIPECPAHTSVYYTPKFVEYNGFHFKLQFWDPPGQERFKEITRAYLLNTDIIFLMFCSTSSLSLNDLHYWIQKIQDQKQDRRLYYPMVYLIETTIDLEELRAIAPEEAETFVAENEIILDLFRISNRTGEGIQEMIENVVRRYVEMLCH